MTLQPRHKSFANEYLSNGQNAKQAYLAVYKCTEKTAGVCAYRVLDYVSVREYIAVELEKREEKTTYNREVLTSKTAIILEKNVNSKDIDEQGLALRSIDQVAKLNGLYSPQTEDSGGFKQVLVQMLIQGDVNINQGDDKPVDNLKEDIIDV